MKRSEAVDLMEDTWLKYTRNLTPDFQGIRHGMELVLKSLEDAGMLPPTVEFQATGEFEKLSNLDILSDYDISFSWEPEDES